MSKHPKTLHRSTPRQVAWLSAKRAAAAVLCMVLALLAGVSGPVQAADYVKISGQGSTWSANAMLLWKATVNGQGMKVDFAPTGSTAGRTAFSGGQADYAVSEIPYGMQDGPSVGDPVPNRKFAYLPIVAGGTALMYNLKVNGKRVENLRLSGENVAKIFTGVLTKWNDPAIAADNPGLQLPDRKIIPVVRQDPSGSSAQFTAYLLAEHRAIWQAYCAKTGRNPCTQTSEYPVVPGSGFAPQTQSTGVQTFIRQASGEGSIGYVEYSYTREAGFPAAKLLNKSGYYVLPTPQNTAVALQGAQINTADPNDARNYLTSKLEGVYAHPDKRAYPMSSYSYMIVPTGNESGFTNEKGFTLGAFISYFLCDGQVPAQVKGYSPLPKNLVLAGFQQAKRIPGAVIDDGKINGCRNPTFSPDGRNLLAEQAPMPAECDKVGAQMCTGSTAKVDVISGNGGSGGPSGGPAGGAPGAGGKQGTTGAAGGAGGPAGGPGGGTGGAGGALQQVGTDANGNPIMAPAGGGAGADGTTGADGTAGAGGDQVAGGAGTAGAGISMVDATPVSLAANGAGGRGAFLGILALMALLGVILGPVVYVKRFQGGHQA